MSRVCTKYNQDKKMSIDNFRQCKYKSGKLYFKSICRKCEIESTTLYSKSHEKNDLQKQAFLQYKKQWRSQNKKSENEKYRFRFANDISFRLRKNVSRSILRALRKENGIKLASIQKYLPYSIVELKQHIESQFNKNMSWTNYGKYWEIDHIIPQSCLKYMSLTDENFTKCWALSNLRPLEIHINRADGSTKIRHKIYTNLSNGES